MRGIATALKTLKHPHLIIFCQARAGICYGHSQSQKLGSAFNTCGVNAHRAGFGKFHRIADDIAQGLPQAKTVTHSAGGKILIHAQSKRDFLALGNGAVQAHTV